MKYLPVICIMGLVSLAACQEKEQEKPAPASMTDNEELPATQRAAKAAENVRPALERDLSAVHLKFGDPVFIRAFKEERQLELFVLNRTTKKFDLSRTYPIAAMSGNLGPKLVEGDSQAPEGFYHVPPEAMNPGSQFHLSFDIGYPNDFDRALGRTGTFIMVHGNRVSIGCLAMTDEKIEEIYTLCDAAHNNGQAFFRVHIFPFRMTGEKMSTIAGDPNESFWKNLKEGYDFFETNKVPPNTNTKDGNYVFSAE